MATHSSVLAWRIPGTGEPGGLPSMGSHRVGHDCQRMLFSPGIVYHVGEGGIEGKQGARISPKTVGGWALLLWMEEVLGPLT